MSLTQVDFDIIMNKLDKFEEELKKLEKEIEELSIQTNNYVLSQGSLVDSGTTQEWRVAKSNEDVEE